jgi:hypothetical protein
VEQPGAVQMQEFPGGALAHAEQLGAFDLRDAEAVFLNEVDAEGISPSFAVRQIVCIIGGTRHEIHLQPPL